MNNNLKRVLFVLFVVSTLLLVIGSASADNVELNENLEASLDLDDGLSVDDSPASNPDSRVSNQLTISNIDEETDTTQSVDEDLNNLNSNDVVSNNEDATINAKDSAKNIKAENDGANNLGANAFDLQVRCLNDSVEVGDTVSFEIVGTSHGDPFQGIIPINVMYSEDEMHYTGYTAGVNYNVPDWYDMGDHISNAGNAHDWWDHQLFEYSCWDVPFFDGFYFNFTVNFEAKKPGNPGTYTVIEVSNKPAAEVRTLVKEPAPNFILEDKVLTPIVNVGDTVAFEIFGRNIGGAYTGQTLPIRIQYDEKELHCIGYSIGVNPDVPEMDFSNNYQVDIGFDGFYDSVNVDYDCGGNFAQGHCFNFTLYFKVITDENPTPGCHAYMPWNDNGEDWPEAINTTRISLDSSLERLLTQVNHDASFGDVIGLGSNQNIIFTKTATQEFVKPGDAVDFVVYLENLADEGLQCKNYLLTLYDYYPTDGFKYIGYEVDSESSTHPDRINVEKRWDGHVQITQQLESNYFAAHEVLKVVLHFEALKNGILCNHLFLNDLKEENHITGSVVSGEPDLNLTKTAQEKQVDLNDHVFFDIVVKNDGDIAFYDHANQLHKLVIIDSYPEGLKYIGFKVNELTQDGTVAVNDSVQGVLNITYTFDDENWHPETEKRFEPGSLINITLEFVAEEYGKWTNNANVYWKFKDWGEEAAINVSSEDSVLVGKPEFTIEKVASEKEVKVGDKVSFKITYTNTGKIDLTGVYITDNDYSEGLVYSDFSDKSLWTFDGKDTWYYNDVLPVGESAVLELTFEATTPGEKTNTAIGGHNVTDDTSEANDTVLVKEETKLESPEEEPEEEPEESPEKEPEEEPEETPDGVDAISGEKAPVKKIANIPPAGNPLFVLLISLMSLCFVSLRGKK